jgi:hypothetical protein
MFTVRRFFIQAGLPLTGEKRASTDDRAGRRLSHCRSGARGHLLGAGDPAADLAGRLRHSGSFAMLCTMKSILW